MRTFLLKNMAMGKNSMRQTVKAVSEWRESLTHIKERKKKQAEKNRNRNKRR
jgi:hypothetical protein